MTNSPSSRSPEGARFDDALAEECGGARMRIDVAREIEADSGPAWMNVGITRALTDVVASFDAWSAKELPRINADLGRKNLPAIQPITRDQWDKSSGGDAAAPAARSLFERD